MSVNPSDYPARLLVRPANPPAGALCALAWQDLPWQPDVLAVFMDTLSEGGAVLLMARNQVELLAKRLTIDLLLADAGGAA